MTGAQLNRHLSPLHVWSLAFGCIIGWGAFMMPGTTFLPTAGTLGTTLAMVIGALVMVVISLSYSYMVSRHPKAGGEFVFARACFGRHHAFVCGWFLALAYLANVPMNCTALGLMTRKLFFGVFQFGRLYQIAGYDIWAGEILLSLTVLSVIAFLSVKGVRKSGISQTIMAFVLEYSDRFAAKIENLLKTQFFNPGHAGEVVGKYILESLINRKKGTKK